MTPTATARPTPSPVPGDLDADLVPDAAFVGFGGAPEVVMKVNNRPTVVRLKASALAAFVGAAPGETKASVIFATKAGLLIQWRAMNPITGATRTFLTVPSGGVPLGGCYVNNQVTGGAYQAGKPSASVRFYGRPDTLVKLPLDTIFARCGPPISGMSTIFALVDNRAKNTTTVVAQSGARILFTSMRVDPGLSNLAVSPVSRGATQPPTALIFGRRGAKSELQILDRSNKWRPIVVPGAPGSSVISGAVAVRVGQATVIVVQYTNVAKAISYQVVTVPAGIL